MFMYYENGRSEKWSMRKAYRLFNKCVGSEQKSQGTDFFSWLSEMERMQILIREEMR